jgi:hypothetical protein
MVCNENLSFLDPEAIMIQARGPSGTLIKEQGSPELIIDYGAQRAHLIRPRCIRTIRSQTKCQSSSSSSIRT